MSGVSGSPKEPATNNPIRREIEQPTLFIRHREEMREVKARWRQAMGRRVDRALRDFDSPLAAD